MADRRVRPAFASRDAWGALESDEPPVRDVMRGIDHHLEVDLWFHEHDVFTAGERATAAALRNAGTSAKKLVLFAHPLWEMCLDGALVREIGAASVRDAVARSFTEGSAALQLAATAHHFFHVEGSVTYRDEFDANMSWLARELSSGPWIEGYARADGLTRGLAGMRRRVGLPPFNDGDRERITAEIATLEQLADATLARILAM